MWSLIKSIMLESLGFYRTHTRHVLAYAAWFFLPSVLTILVNDAGRQYINAQVVLGNDTRAQFLEFSLMFVQLLFFFLQMWIIVAYTRAVAAWHDGKEDSHIISALKSAAHRTPQAVTIWLIMSFMTILGIGVGLVSIRAGFFSTGLLSALVLFILGLYVTVRLVYALTIVVLEPVTILHALKKSSQMVRARWWYTLVVILVPLFVFSSLAGLLIYILEIPLTLYTVADVQISGLLFGATLLISIVTSLVNAATAPLMFAVPTIMYLKMKR